MGKKNWKIIEVENKLPRKHKKLIGGLFEDWDKIPAAKNLSKKAINMLIEKNLGMTLVCKGIKEVKLSKIKLPPAFLGIYKDYLWDIEQETDGKDTKESMDPICIVKLKDEYVITDGVRRFNQAKKDKKKTITALIEGEIECYSQAATLRGRRKTQRNEVLNPIETAMGLIMFELLLRKELGKKVFYSHGGNRKNIAKKKYKYIANLLGMAPTTVGTLLRFASTITKDGLKGILNSRVVENLTVKKINQMNAALKKSGLPDKVKTIKKNIKSKELSPEEGRWEIENIVKETIGEELRISFDETDWGPIEKNDDLDIDTNQKTLSILSVLISRNQITLRNLLELKLDRNEYGKKRMRKAIEYRDKISRDYKELLKVIGEKIRIMREDQIKQKKRKPKQRRVAKRDLQRIKKWANSSS